MLLTFIKYKGEAGGNTIVLPVAAANININSRFIRILFQPPRSGSNVIYFGLFSNDDDLRKGDLKSISCCP
jgi:hypothetical protein